MRVKYVDLAGRRYPFCCSLAAIERIEEEFGSLEAMGETLSVGTNGQTLSTTIRAAETVLGIFLDAGRVYASAVGEEVPPPLPCRIAEVMDLLDSDVIGLIFEVISTGGKREVEAVPKNAEAAAEAAASRGSATPDTGQD